MTSVTAFNTAVLAALRARPHLDVHSEADPEYRTDPDGRLHIAAWAQLGPATPSQWAGRATGERPVDRADFQVTAVGGDPDRCIRAALHVRAALHNQFIAGALVLEEELRRNPPREDPESTPTAYYIPLLYTATLNNARSHP